MLRSAEGLKDDIEVETTKDARTNFGNPKECCKILLKHGVDNLGKEDENEMFESGLYAELNPSLIDRYRLHLLYWSAYLNEIEHCRRILEFARNKVGKVIKWKNELKVVKAIVYPGQRSTVDKSSWGRSDSVDANISNKSESLSVETRIDITRNEQSHDGLVCLFDPGGGLVLKPTVDGDVTSKGAIVAKINELPSAAVWTPAKATTNGLSSR